MLGVENREGSQIYLCRNSFQAIFFNISSVLPRLEVCDHDEGGRISSDIFHRFSMDVPGTYFKLCDISQFMKLILSFVALAKSLNRQQVLFLTPYKIMTNVS